MNNNTITHTKTRLAFDIFLKEANKSDQYFNMGIASPTIINKEKEASWNNDARAAAGLMLKILNLAKKSIKDENSLINRLYFKTRDNKGFNERAKEQIDYLENDSKAITAPLFFRMDKAANDKIVEIQCPGSGWATLDAMLLAFFETKIISKPPRIIESMALIIQAATKKAEPAVYYDKHSSYPGDSNLLLKMASASGINIHDTHLMLENFDYIKNHSYFSFRKNQYFKQALQSEAIIDPPPLAIFSSKLFCCLPFHKDTQEFLQRKREIYF
jgi:hypothetical protein